MSRYDGSLTREQFMYAEMRIVARLFLEGATDEEILRRVKEENLFQYPTEREIMSKCRACLKRLDSLKQSDWLCEELAYGDPAEGSKVALVAILSRSRLLSEFMLTVVVEKYRRLDFTLTQQDMYLFFEALREHGRGKYSVGPALEGYLADIDPSSEVGSRGEYDGL